MATPYAVPMPINFAQETEEQKLMRELEQVRRMQEKYAGGILPPMPQPVSMAPNVQPPMRPPVQNTPLQNATGTPVDSGSTVTTQRTNSPADVGGGILGALKEGVTSGSLGDALLSMSYHQNLQELGAKGMERREAKKQANKTAEMLRTQYKREDLAKAVESGALSGKEALGIVYAQPEDSRTSGIKEYEYAVSQGYKGSFEQFKSSMAKAGATSLDLGLGKDYATELGGLFATEDMATKAAAANAARVIPKLQETIALIKDPATNVGLFANINTAIDKFFASLGADPKSLDQTELLNAYLGSDVFAALGALGLGSKNMDTPAEREFLREVMTGNITNSRGSLLRMAEERLNAQQNALDSYNRMVESGEFAYTKGTPLETRFSPITFDPYVAPKAAPKAGDIIDGYRFLGGDPNDERNYEQVK